MKVSFLKTSHLLYTLRCERDDDSVTERTLEARSLLAHDLCHFAYERDAGRRQSFFAGIAAGALLDAALPLAGELAVTELLVGPIQSAVKSGVAGADLLVGLHDYAAAQGVTIPPDVTPELIDGVLTWVRTTLRRYEGLRTGDALSFSWVVAGGQVN